MGKSFVIFVNCMNIPTESSSTEIFLIESYLLSNLGLTFYTSASKPGVYSTKLALAI